MKTTKLFLFLSLLVLGHGLLFAQDVTTVEAIDENIGENLDLEAVASVFTDSEDLEDFEKRLNDPKTQISNLDLNGDGEVDYLRVLESSKDNTHVVTIQAVIGKNQFQDVATIDVEKDDKGETTVQVVGDVHMYGPGYIVHPIYVRPPVIIIWFWGPVYRPWRSPYYWGYYPPYYRPWRPHPRNVYRTQVNVHVHKDITFNRTSVRQSKTAVEIQRKDSKKDYSRNPSQYKKSSDKAATAKSKAGDTKSTGKKVDDNWKTASEKAGKDSKVKDNKVSVPSNKTPKSKPSSKPANKPATKPKSKPKAKPKKGRKN
ncbi:hypothetical protein [Sediminicola luteus]|uniref:EF-hand domain-containing protein n=1 Tax=Sediminicola luteus TaxID=319238 RepID=A0A2A4GAM3_9FLAO|nr:hypothetical protein [Sediminicola luteus]PCE65028.1 hypothetical protein B7P33_07705 [Sediminicola luteus]